MDLVNVEPDCVRPKEAQVANHSDKVQDCWCSLYIRRHVYHSVPFIWIISVEEQPKKCWDYGTLNQRQSYTRAQSRTKLGWELLTDDRWGQR
jgi:hypothetical protein